MLTKRVAGVPTQAGTYSRQIVWATIHTTPLNASLDPRVLLGLPIPGRNLLTAGSVIETLQTHTDPMD